MVGINTHGWVQVENKNTNNIMPEDTVNPTEEVKVEVSPEETQTAPEAETTVVEPVAEPTVEETVEAAPQTEEVQTPTQE
jgi:hypothetical protein